MIIHSSSQTYIRPNVKVGVRRRVRANGRTNLVLDLQGLKALGRGLLIVLPVFLAINLFVGSSIDSIEHSISVLETKRQELEDKNIQLLAQKARKYAPDNVEKLAGEKLSLYATGKKQVGRFNRRTGTFSYM